MALREVGVFEQASLPSAYSFWASIMIRVLSEGVAEDGGTPTRERKDGALDIVMRYVISQSRGRVV